MQEPNVKQFRQQAEQYFRKHVAPQEVEDLVQDTLYRLLVAEARNVKITAELVSHLCHAVWVDYLRQQVRRAERECALEDGDCCVSWEAQVIVSIDLSQCLGRLTASERQLVQWHWVEGETCAVIGERLGIREEAVKKRLQRVKQKLRNLLAGYGGGRAHWDRRCGLEAFGYCSGHVRYGCRQLRSAGSVAPASWATGVGRGCAVAVQCGEKGRLRCPLFGGLVDRISE